VRLAHASGVDVFALTDHDEVSGLAEAAQTARDLGLGFVPGVEISVTWKDHTLHIVGLGIDAGSEPLVQGLAGVRGSRRRRGERIADALSDLGIKGSLEGALAYADKPDVLSRTHFARFLVERNHAPDVRSVFDHYLAKGKPGYVPHTWASLPDAIGWIVGSGGVAVIAHPGRYKLSNQELYALFEEFRGLGGQAIEVITGSHTPDQYGRFARYARKFGFAASRGSDFHGPGETRMKIGALQALPEDLTPVWRLL
jgi:predicted metal-dependent phosphoesterase TrpH